ncbi:hypothetical protein [Parabacteroides sp. FAFU027]|uniref:hypothetical protein n=1 Tax=Parabacteroides sp. FAFU027 TaxID=2922715 RepID=UPI001FAF704C|nr:hypothetical protein [Parabacteroides sp. FAFU027]
MVYPQEGLSIQLGPSISLPDNSFKHISVSNAGVDLGVEYKYPLNKRGLDIMFSADFLNNRYTLDNSSYYSNFGSYSKYACPIPTNKYVSISSLPLLTGLSLHKEFIEDSEFFISGGIGPNFMLVPNIEYYWYGEKEYYKSGIYTMLSTKLSTGFVVDEKYSFKIDYFMFWGHFPDPVSGILDLDFVGLRRDPVLALTFGVYL